MRYAKKYGRGGPEGPPPRKLGFKKEKFENRLGTYPKRLIWYENSHFGQEESVLANEKFVALVFTFSSSTVRTVL